MMLMIMVQMMMTTTMIIMMMVYMYQNDGIELALSSMVYTDEGDDTDDKRISTMLTKSQQPDSTSEFPYTVTLHHGYYHNWRNQTTRGDGGGAELENERAIAPPDIAIAYHSGPLLT